MRVSHLVQWSMEFASMSVISGRLRMASFHALYLVVYVESGVGLGGPNFLRLWQMADLILSVKVPFIVIGDWNEPLQALINIRWAEFLHATIVQPADISYTCRTGQVCLLDSAVVRYSLVP